MEDLQKDLIRFLERSPSAFHAIANVEQELDEAGFERLGEQSEWQLKKGRRYYTVRNGSSIIAFRIPENDFTGFQITASHSDSPAFKLKETAEIDVNKKYTKLNVEGYGGMLCTPWFDRPLSIAGRVIAREGDQITTRLVNIDQDLLLIPNLAIHMNRKANEGYTYNIQRDMLPLAGGADAGKALRQMIAENAGVKEDEIVGQDLFLYNRQPAAHWGVGKEYFSAPRIDNLECAYTTLQGFLGAETIGNAAVYCVFDNEEVGSSTKQGAGSTFLKDVLRRISLSFGSGEESYYRYLAGSFMVSADNAHALHPNIPDKSDKTNRVYMNDGIVIKHSANQKYTTDGVSRGIFKAVCDSCEVPVQDFANRSDEPGGSTLGSIANTQTPMNTVDIGLAQLAMHSPFETAGVKDPEYMVRAITKFYESHIVTEGNGNYRI